MNTALLDEPPALAVAVPTAETLTSVALYIDADNQSPQCAQALLGLVRGDFGARITSATIAGNNHGHQIDTWRNELVSALPDLPVHALTAPHRKQGADVALLMALGADLERHLRERMVIVIVSRDDLLVGAAEQAKARGCRTLIAYADGDVATARNAHLTTLLLPALPKPLLVASRIPIVALATTPTTSARSSAPIPVGGEVASVLARVRDMCAKKPGGGYSATDVGQALSKLGYDKAARARFLASVPGLTKRGTGPGLTLVF
jgi:hypothetical protein